MTYNKKPIGKGLRPIFIPDPKSIGVIEIDISFDWHMGMSKEVRLRSIKSLHDKAKLQGHENILEASSKSLNPIGISLSAFFLKNKEGIAVENLFQSSKVFDGNKQFLDLRHVSPKQAKQDQRLKTSGNLIKFSYQDVNMPLEPKSLFYDWLYCSTLNQPHNKDISKALLDAKFDAFSDIEFNPKKSFSCQARTLALYVSLNKNGLLNEFISDPSEISNKHKIYKEKKHGDNQGKLF